MSKFQINFKSERLRFSRPRMSDAKDIFKNLLSNFDVVKYLSIKRHQDVRQTITFVNDANQQWKLDDWYYLWKIEAENKLIGLASVILDKRHTDEIAEFGYMLMPGAWGLGYGTEIVKKISEIIFNNPNIRRLEGYADQENFGSHKTLLKNKFSKEGVVREYARTPNLKKSFYRPSVLFSLLRSDV